MLAETLTYLRAMFPSAQFPPETVTVYVEELADLPDEEVAAACRRLGRRALFLPKVGEIRREVMEARLCMPTVSEAWDIVLRGEALKPGVSCPPLAEAYRAIGGGWALRHTPDTGRLRHQFERDYDQRRERTLLVAMGAVQPSALPPAGRELLAADLPSTPVERRMARRFLGHDLTPPTDEEKSDAIRVLRQGTSATDPKGDAIYAEAERIFAEGAS